MVDVWFQGKDALSSSDSYQGIHLSAGTVAEYCQVSKSTVLKWIKDGKLQAFRLPSGHYRIDKEDFRDFLERWDMPIREGLFKSEGK